MTVETYSTNEQVQNFLKERAVSATGPLTPSDIEEFRLRAKSVVDSKLALRYTTPFVKAGEHYPPIITSLEIYWAASLALEVIFQAGSPNESETAEVWKEQFWKIVHELLYENAKVIAWDGDIITSIASDYNPPGYSTSLTEVEGRVYTDSDFTTETDLVKDILTMDL